MLLFLNIYMRSLEFLSQRLYEMFFRKLWLNEWKKEKRQIKM